MKHQEKDNKRISENSELMVLMLFSLIFQMTVFKYLYSNGFSWHNLCLFNEEYESLKGVGHIFYL